MSLEFLMVLKLLCYLQFKMWHQKYY